MFDVKIQDNNKTVWFVLSMKQHSGVQTDLKLGRLRSSITEAAIFKRYPSDVLIVQDKTSWVLFFKRWLFWDLLQETMALAKGLGEYEDSLPCAFIIIRQAGHLKGQNMKSEIVDSSNYNNVLWVKTSQELRMLSRSPSDCRSLLLNLNLNLNRCLSSDCSDCSAIVVLW